MRRMLQFQYLRRMPNRQWQSRLSLYLYMSLESFEHARVLPKSSPLLSGPKPSKPLSGLLPRYNSAERMWSLLQCLDLSAGEYSGRSEGGSFHNPVKTWSTKLYASDKDIERGRASEMGNVKTDMHARNCNYKDLGSVSFSVSSTSIRFDGIPGIRYYGFCKRRQKYIFTRLLRRYRFVTCLDHVSRLAASSHHLERRRIQKLSTRGRKMSK